MKIAIEKNGIQFPEEGYFSGEVECLIHPLSQTVFGSHLVPLKAQFSHHLLRVDMPCFVKGGVLYDVNVSSADVIHSFALPKCGIKVDAVPGKGNHVFSEFGPGVLYGQCSEICGVNHTRMPIVLVSFNSGDVAFDSGISFLSDECAFCHGVGRVIYGLNSLLPAELTKKPRRLKVIFDGRFKAGESVAKFRLTPKNVVLSGRVKHPTPSFVGK